MTREVTIAAAPETVWEFLVDPHKVALWLGESVELDARPGGAFRIGVARGHTARGEFVELDPPHRLVYTWGWGRGRHRLVGAARLEHDRVRPRGGGGGDPSSVRAPRPAEPGVGGGEQESLVGELV